MQNDWRADATLVILMLLGALILGPWLGGLVANAQVGCTTTTVIGPDGTVRVCTVCGNIVTCY
jgi:hypothetical protein